MGFKIPISQPLTDSQAELTSKIGSMKSLLSFTIDTHFTIPKGEQISTMDYLLKVMRALGIEPEIIFNIFLDKIFGATSTFLEENVIGGIADSMGQKGRQLKDGTTSHINNPTATQEEKDGYKKVNRKVLAIQIPPTFLQTVKQQIAKSLVVMIFGPKDGPSEVLVPNSAGGQTERERLIKEAVCGMNLFSVSSDPMIKKEDIEYNRVKLKEQLEKGEVIFEVSCQEIKVHLPENPGYIFGDGGQFTAASTLPPTPTQSITTLVQHVKNTGQRINNEENSNSIGKSFFEILIGKLLGYISSLVFPFLQPVFDLIWSYDPASSDLNPSNVAYSNCDISESSSDPAQNPKEKQEFLKSLANALLKELLRFMLVFVIKKFKNLVANYFARTSVEKQKRKSEKIKQKYTIFNGGDVAAKASKASKYASAALTLKGVLEQSI